MDTPTVPVTGSPQGKCQLWDPGGHQGAAGRGSLSQEPRDTPGLSCPGRLPEGPATRGLMHWAPMEPPFCQKANASSALQGLAAAPGPAGRGTFMQKPWSVGAPYCFLPAVREKTLLSSKPASSCRCLGSCGKGWSGRGRAHNFRAHAHAPRMFLRTVSTLRTTCRLKTKLTQASPRKPASQDCDTRGAGLARGVKCLSAFGAGHDLGVLGSSPELARLLLPLPLPMLTLMLPVFLSIK